MPFSAGDILLKVDLRATAETIMTRHHAMLVIGESENGHPLIVHMLAAPEWGLVQEELARGKELTLIHYPWSAETRMAIVKAASGALSCNKFQINRNIIKKHLQESLAFRPDCSLEARRKLEHLHDTFATRTNIDFNPTPNDNKIMSCHEWVLTIIHYACQQTKESIPIGLQIPPHLAWADLLWYSAQNDPLLSCSTVRIKPAVLLKEVKPEKQAVAETPLAITQAVAEPESNMQWVMSFFSFFYSEKLDQKPASEMSRSTSSLT